MGTLEELLNFEYDRVTELQDIGRQHSKNAISGAQLLLYIHDDERLTEDERDYLLFQTGLNFGYREYLVDTLTTQEITERLIKDIEE